MASGNDMTVAQALVRGFWASDSGECHIFNDKVTNKLSYEELIGDGSERLHGWLEEVAIDGENEKDRESGPCYTWQASLSLLEKGDQPWYGPSCGEQPEVVGDLQVIVRPSSDGSPPQFQTRIKTDDDEDWQAAVSFKPVPEDEVAAESKDE
eukprot:TRINITY_DN67447_c0_g1_i1.p1 TRINITY_DN67447_c0_g1~~TRINITY_DN67447_c0_g1_i1.p1  ORF type:complete len:178 (+),score=41.75 TRINITY_DN67447_c0_g1_i1:80-535(+)